MDKFDLYSHMSETDLQKVGLLPSNFEDDEETIDANSSEEEDQVNDADSIPSEVCLLKFFFHFIFKS